jgi:hypothetical protein
VPKLECWCGTAALGCGIVIPIPPFAGEGSAFCLFSNPDSKKDVKKPGSQDLKDLHAKISSDSQRNLRRISRCVRDLSEINLRDLGQISEIFLRLNFGRTSFELPPDLAQGRLRR